MPRWSPAVNPHPSSPVMLRFKLTADLRSARVASNCGTTLPRQDRALIICRSVVQNDGFHLDTQRPLGSHRRVAADVRLRGSPPPNFGDESASAPRSQAGDLSVRPG